MEKFKQKRLIPNSLKDTCFIFSGPALYRILAIFYFFAFSILGYAQQKTYYISNGGNDGNDGRSLQTAWRSVSRASEVDLNPGDSLLLQGGQVHEGFLFLSREDLGLKMSPIVISSFGTGRATIKTSEGIFGYNAGGIEILNLIIQGKAPNTENGIYFLINQSDADINYILLKNLDISGFGKTGVFIGAHLTDKGFNDVAITHCNIHDNGHAGIETFGFYPKYSHTKFYIAYNKTYNNPGTLSTNTVSGSGITVSGVDTAVVEYCEAYNNGQNNRNTTGGPVGIWTYDARNVIIQFCESHHNKAGLNKDGGGFDIDGGSQNCIVQYCYSHDNEGAGYTMCEYGSPNTYSANFIRFNISQNDGRKNKAGSLSFWGVDTIHKINNSWVYNNIFYVDSTKLAFGQPVGVEIFGRNMNGIHVVNNIFYTKKGIALINSPVRLSTSEIYFRNNDYYSTGTPIFSWGGTKYYSLSSWKTSAMGQEREGSISYGYSSNPLLVNPGGGGTVGALKLTTVTAYQLKSNSPMIDAGIDITNKGNRDYYGTSILNIVKSDIGAAEFKTLVSSPGLLEAERAFLSGVKIASIHPGYTGTGFGDYINNYNDYIQWTINKVSAGNASLSFRFANGSLQDRPLKLIVNGKVVAGSLSFPRTGAWNKWINSAVITTYLPTGANKIRLTAIGYSGSNIDNLMWKETTTAVQNLEIENVTVVPTDFKVFVSPNPASGDKAKLIVSRHSDMPLRVMLADISGKVHGTYVFTGNKGNYHNIPISNLPAGVYIVLVTQGKDKAHTRFVVAK